MAIHGSTGPPGVEPERWHSASVMKRAGPDLEVTGVLRVILGAANLILWTFYLPTLAKFSGSLLSLRLVARGRVDFTAQGKIVLPFQGRGYFLLLCPENEAQGAYTY